jgi:hypothetical protein
MRITILTIFLLSVVFVRCNFNTTSDINDEINDRLTQAFSTEMLHLKDLDTFDSLSVSLMNTNYEFVKNWASKTGFKSLRQVYEEVVDDQINHMKTLESQYSNPTEISLTWDQIGYTELAKKYIEKGIIIIDDYGAFEINATLPIYSALLNEDGMISINNEYYKFDRNYVAKTNNINQIKDFLTFENAKRSGLLVFEVNSSNYGRSKTGLSCISTVGNYRLIVYENDVTQIGTYGYPCQADRYHFWTTLRSLHKTLGQWFNHKTNYLRIAGTLNLNMYSRESTSHSPNPGPPYIIFPLFNQWNYNIELPYDHTVEYYYTKDFLLNCVGDYTEGRCKVIVLGANRVLVGYGKNGTTCSVPSYSMNVDRTSCKP